MLDISIFRYSDVKYLDVKEKKEEGRKKELTLPL